jgi:hypothetical protein
MFRFRAPQGSNGFQRQCLNRSRGGRNSVEQLGIDEGFVFSDAKCD